MKAFAWTSTVLVSALWSPASRADLPPATPVIAVDDLRQLSFVKGLGATAEVVAVTGEPFVTAVQVSVPVRSPVWDGVVRGTCLNLSPVAKGDTLLLTFWMKADSPLDGSTQLSVSFEQSGGLHERSCKAILSPSGQWTRVDLPFKSIGDYPAGAADLAFHFGFAAQVVELGGIALADFGQNTPIGSLPATKPTYVGRAPDAPWRAVAEANIDRYRKGDVTVTVVDAQGRPVPGATVEARMTRHAFPFGTCVDSKYLFDPGPDGVTYRAKLTSLFTMAVPGNELKWNHWEQAPALGLATVQWLAAHNLAVRGHNLVWQSWRFQSNDFHRDYAAHLTSLGATGTSSWLSDTIDRHITDEMTPLRGQCAQWDVVNEGVDNHLFQDVIGPGAMAHWFQVAHEADPAAELLLNEDASIYGQTNPERVEDALAEASSLVASGAPVGAVGLESHMSPWALPSPDQVSETFAAYAKLNLPVVITEYDLKTYDKELEADYTRDFMTLCFSNPNVQAFVMWGFWDRDHWLGDSPLFNADWTLKPSGQAYLDLVFKKWWTSVAGATDAAGRFGFRGFQGDYEVTVSFAGKHQTRAFRAGPGQTPLTLQLI